ncbi:MAG: tetratricopeptide repeat protein [Sphingobacteriia bacterium]|nr:tetratricopeptide repeat protein [Sphingobacteriia bacterium]
MSKLKYYSSLVVIALLLTTFSSFGRGSVVSLLSVPDSVSQASLKRNADEFSAAYKNLLLGDKSEAQKRFEDLVVKYPWDAASRYELAKIYVENTRYEDASGLMKTATTLDDKNVYYFELLAQISEALGDSEMLMASLEHLTILKPEKGQYQMAYAQLLAKNREFKKALSATAEAEKSLGFTEEVAFMRRDIFLAMNKEKDAIKELKKLAELNPDEPKYKTMVADFFVSAKRYKEAKKEYLSMIQADSSNVYTWISLADLYRQMGEESDMNEALQQAFKNPSLGSDSKLQLLFTFYTTEQLYGTKIDNAKLLAKALMTAHPTDSKVNAFYGDLMFRMRDYPEAKKGLLASMAADSSRYFVWEQLLIIFSTDGDSNNLDKYSKRAVELFPYQPIPYYFYGLKQYRLKNYAEALKLFKSGVDLVNENPVLSGEFYKFIGDISHEIGNVEESDRAYEKSLQYDPDDGYVLNNYAYYLALRGENLEKALSMAERAVELNPGNSNNLDTYAWVLFKRKDYKEALVWILKAIKASNSLNGTLLEHYGDILWFHNQKEEAIKLWQQAKEAGAKGTTLETKLSEKRYVE